MRPFVPLLSNPHLLTIAAHLWPRRTDERRYPVKRVLYRTEADAQVLVEEQRPGERAIGELVLAHGLESSSRAGCMLSLAQAALEAGFATHRLNLRGCGGTEHLSRTAYHSGLTCDLLAVTRALAERGRPVFLAGFSLGGNVVLKLAGELAEAARGLVAGACAVSPPIELEACVRCLERRENRGYELRILRSLKRRMRVKHELLPHVFPLQALAEVRSVREFDDRVTAGMFGFRGAAEYYETQSAARFLDAIRVPIMLIQAQDDPLVPFSVFEQLANPRVTLVATEHGGHLGFLARRQPRFWADEVIVAWLRNRLDQ